MHIFLDTNAIGVNYRLDSIPFENLWDYMRRTESVLVIPEAVRREVTANFNRHLDQRTKKAQSSWDDLNALLASPQEFDEPDADYERDSLAERLESPDDNVKCVNYVAPIDVLEVVRRGAQRVRPANSNGEELRDVIIWLTAVEYAKANNVPVAFVSGDKGFWDDDRPHATINSDIQQAGVKIELYRDVDSFIRSNSLSENAISEQDAMTFLDRKVAESRVLQWLQTASTFWRNARLRSMDVEAFEFIEGALFDVDSKVQLAELLYRCRVRMAASTSVTTEVMLNPTRLFTDTLVYDSRTANTQLQQMHQALSAYTLQPTLPSLVYGRVLPEPSFLSAGTVVSGLASFSVRMVDGCVERTALDDFVVETADEVRLDSNSGSEVELREIKNKHVKCP